jgi:hypothetical protein
MAETPSRGSEAPRRRLALPFGVQLAVLIALLVAVPVVAEVGFDLDGRTPSRIAEDTLREKYDLARIGPHGHALPAGSSDTSVSDFRTTDGAVTEDVPFLRHGERVTCTVRVPDDDPRLIEAECQSDPG